MISVVEDLKERGVHFVRLNEGFDTSTPPGQLVFNMFVALAQFERDLIVERTKAGLKAARVRGRKPPLNTRQIQAVRAMLSAGSVTVQEAAEQFGVGTVYSLPFGCSAAS